MPTRFSHQIRYPAPLDQVGEMLDDKAFRERVCREQLVLRHRVAISDQPRGLEVLVERVHSTDPMPTAARRLLGPEITVVQDELWVSTAEAEVRVRVPDQPAEIDGGIVLAEEAGSTSESVSLAIRVSVPLLGGKLEGFVADLLRAALEVEHRVGLAWLAD